MEASPETSLILRRTARVLPRGRPLRNTNLPRTRRKMLVSANEQSLDIAKCRRSILTSGGAFNPARFRGNANLFEFAQPFLARAELNYVWTLCWYTRRGASTHVLGRKIKSNWKPVLWFVKGKNRNEHVSDVVTPTLAGTDPRFHRHGQDIGGFVDLVKRFTVKGDLVCDPFCGGGTTGVACLLTERKFLGIDADGRCVAETEKRLRRL